MAAFKTLLQLRTLVIQGAGIFGQTGASGRHPTATLDEMINRYIEAVRSLVRTEGGPQFQKLGDIADIPAATANEDFIAVPWPDDAEEVTGVDVLSSGCPEWRALDDADWEQRRALNFSLNYPQGGVGWWAVKDMPEARGSTTVDAGTLALFPSDLSGSYRISYVEQFTPLSDDTHKWVCHADWATWVVASCVMEISQGDNNKRKNYEKAEASLNRAQLRIENASGRAGPGCVVPTRVGGEWV